MCLTSTILAPAAFRDLGLLALLPLLRRFGDYP